MKPADLDALDIPSELGCPYFHGLGTCASGCWSEPSCQTDEPLGGWRIRDLKGRFVSKARQNEAVALIRKLIEGATG